jgi:hypothetical protein
MHLTRRSLLVTASAAALARPALAFKPATSFRGTVRARPLPLSTVRLKPSIFRDQVESNRAYLQSLEPDRFLHNFRKYAGLEPKAPRYGGWEDMGIAGHCLGHYLSALSLMYAQTGDERMRDKVRYIVGELAEVQKARGDGYVGGTTVDRDGKELDGKLIFEEVRRGKIDAQPFSLNGGWVPLYTWHKVHAGMIDAIQLAKVEEAKPVLVGMSDYLAGVLEPLGDEQMQRLLTAEQGGLNESYAETYVLTGNPRYLKLARRIRDKSVLDPLAAGRDVLPGLHANMNIPKVIGLARIHELTGDPGDAAASRFFFDTVVKHHSYVIGGNSDSEHFVAPNVIAAALTDRTCEHCNSYNMLKLTRHLYSWQPDASLFDYYERAHLNHVMAAHDPKTGMFVYYMPLASGAKRTYSTPHDNFWCCVGTGIESHSKHGDSIYWEDGQSLFVNLFIPSTLDWRERGLRLDLDTAFPYANTVALTVARAPGGVLPIAVRLPGWASGPTVMLNGKPAAFERRNGYAVLTHRWSAGDKIELMLPMQLRVEPTPDNPRMMAFTHGPVVLAADLAGPTPAWIGATPGLFGGDPAAALQPLAGRLHHFQMAGAVPGALTLKPFFDQYDRRTAVYFPVYTEAEWAAEKLAWQAREAEAAAVDARTIDLLQPSEFDQERAHDLATNHSEFWQNHERGTREAWWGAGNYVEASMAVRPDVKALRVLYWGEEVNKDFSIIVDGHLLAHERRAATAVKQFIAVEYPLPLELVTGKDEVRVRFETGGTDAPFYELRTVTA